MLSGAAMSTVVISRFEIPLADRPYASVIFEKFKAAVSQHAGYLGTSVWQCVENNDRFMRITEYVSVEAYHKVYDALSQSGTLEKAVSTNAIVPDVQIYNTIVSRYHGLDHLHNAPYLSLSDRVLPTPSHADDWAAKLQYNFDENSLIPGFHGVVIAKHYDVEEQIAGIALWRSPQAFADSQPPGVEYQIDLYKRVA